MSCVWTYMILRPVKCTAAIFFPTWIGFCSTSVRLDEKGTQVLSLSQPWPVVTQIKPFTFRHSSENHSFFMQKYIVLSLVPAFLSSSFLRPSFFLSLPSFLSFDAFTIPYDDTFNELDRRTSTGCTCYYLRSDCV